MDHLLALVAALAPVFLLLALGRGLVTARLLPANAHEALGLVLYWVALPAKLLSEIAATDLRATFAPTALAAGVGAFAVALVAGWWATPRLDPASRGAALNGIARANGAFIGLPVIILAATTLPAAQASLLTAAYATVLAGMVVVFNIGSVVAYRLPHHGLSPAGLRAVLIELPRNPLIVACVLGAAFGTLAPGWLGTTILGRTLDLAGAAAIPLALLTTGAAIDLRLARARPLAVTVISIAKLVLVPALTWVLCHLLATPPAATIAVVVLMACPTAMAAGPMARLLGGDERLVTAVVVTTTAAAPFTLLLWLALLTR